MSQRLLLDTHLAVWAVASSSRLSSRARELIENPQSRLYVSAASIWEIAIKNSLGRGPGRMPFGGEEAILRFRESGLRLLDIRPEHAAAVEQLPALHADPFDRLLIAQARVEPMYLLTHDETLARYGATVMVV